MAKEKRPRRGVAPWFAVAVWGGCALAAAVIFRDEIYAIVTDSAAREGYIEQLRQAGIWGLAAFLCLQVLQVVVAVIPGEPIEVMAGVLYGTMGGLLVCLTGALVGSVIIYYGVKWLGADPFSAPKYHKYRFLQETKKAEILLFVLYLIPGTPKDMLLYIAPFLPVPAKTFFLLVTLARIPSVITSTFAGASLADGNWLLTGAAFVAAGALGLWGILYNEHFLAARQRRRKEKQKEQQGNIQSGNGH